MPISVLQEGQVSTQSAGATSVVSLTMSAGSYLDCYMTCDTSFTLSSITAPGMTFTLVDSTTDSSNAQILYHYVSSNTTSAGSLSVTATWSSSSATSTGLWVKEIGGSSGYNGTNHAANLQTAPGTGTDAVTSGLLGTIATVPALVSALAYTTITGGSGGAFTTGTGYTSGVQGWLFGTGSTHNAASESERVTAGTSIAATFTLSQANRTITQAAVFTEATVAAAQNFDDDFGDFPQLLAGEDDTHEGADAAIIMATYDSAPVGPNAVPLQSNEEYWDLDHAEDYEEPLINDLEWSGPIQPNAPPEPFRNEEPILDFFDPSAVDEETLDFTGEGGVGPNAVFAQYFGEDPEQAWWDGDFYDDELTALAADSQPVGPAAVYAQYFGEDADVGIADDTSDEETLDTDGPPVGADRAVLQYFGEEAEVGLLDDTSDEETLDFDSQCVGLGIVFAQYYGEDAEVGIVDDEGLEEPVDSDSAPVGALAVVAQYFGEDAESSFLEDEGATDEPPLDETPQVPPPVISPVQYYGDEAENFGPEDPEDFFADHFGNIDGDSLQVADPWPHWDDEGYAEDLSPETTDSYTQIDSISPPVEDAWPHWEDESDEEYRDLDQPVGTTAPSLPFYGDESEQWFDDIDEQWLDLEGLAGVVPAAVFAQYYGEDAELGQPDDTIEVDAPLDDYIHGFPLFVTPDQHFGEEAEIWFDDPDEEHFDHYLTQPMVPAAVVTQYYGEDAELQDEEQSDELLDIDQAQPLAPVAQPPEDPWIFDDDDTDELVLSLESQPVAESQPPEDAWDHWAEETIDDYVPPPDPPVAPLPVPQLVEDGWDWSQDETLEETLDFYDQPTGATAVFAQYFGEDAEAYFLEDESAAEDVSLDAIPPGPLLFPSNDIVYYIAQGVVFYIAQPQVFYMPLSPQLQSFRPKIPSEDQVLTFNMTAALVGGNLLQGTPTVTVTSIRGDDPTPNNILNGAPALDATSTLILVPVKGGIPNSRYIIEVNCQTQQPPVQPSLAAILPIGYP